MVTNLGLQARIADLNNCNLTTIGSMASACSWNPEHTTDELVKTNVVMRVCQWDGTGNEPPQASSLKNLLWDCIQEYMQDTRNRHDPRLKDVPVTMAVFSRNERREEFDKKFRDVMPEIDTDIWQPAYDPEDQLLAMLDDNTLGEYMGPECFPTRKAELLAKKKQKKSTKVGQVHNLWKSLTGEELEEEPKITTDVSALHLLEMAFKRRGKLLETTGLMSYAKHEVWRQRLWKAMEQETVWANESAPRIPDILKADERIWSILQEECVSGIQPVNTVKPLETHLETILKKYEIDSLLAVRPRGTKTAAEPSTKRRGSATDNSATPDTKAARRLENQSNQIANLKKRLGNPTESGRASKRLRPGKSSPRPKGKAKGKTKGKGKRKGKGKGKGKKKCKKGGSVPAALIGGETHNENGERFCYGFNLGTCSKVKPGEQCERG